jgi:AcrR family transcriptional regulator
MAQQQRSEETRAGILKAALETFARKGYEEASVAEICQAAGVSKGAFYHHFPAKQALFLELLEEWLGGIDARLAELRSAAPDAAGSLLHMAELARAIFDVADGRLPLFLEFWDQARLDPAVWAATIAPYHRYQAYFEALVRDGIADGSLRETDAAIAARTIVALAVGLLLQGLLDPAGAEWGAVAEGSLQLLLEGLRRRNA